MAENPLTCGVYYRRSRFSTRLPHDRRFVPSHFWLLELEPGMWRIGFTKFATRMLGDLVEHGFEVKPGEPVTLGQTIGWFEGFKATTDLFCVADGTFLETNAALEKEPSLVDEDPYGQGWLYTVRGTADPGSVDTDGYIALLNLAIDKIQGKT